MDKELQEKIEQLQNIEKNLQYILIQKQSMQSQLSEIDTAMEELKGIATRRSYKIIGAVMVESTKESLIKELKSKKELLEVKAKSFEKQEAKLKESAKSIQEEVIEKVNKNE